MFHGSWGRARRLGPDKVEFIVGYKHRQKDREGETERDHQLSGRQADRQTKRQNDGQEKRPRRTDKGK